MHIARAAAAVNFEQQDRFVGRILAELPRSGRVGLLGLSFKAGTDDLRGSPAVRVALGLLQAGHTVIAYDPVVRPERARSAVPGLQLAATAIDVFEDADAAVIATEWPEFAELDWSEAAQRMRCPVLFDGRRLIEPSVAVAAGLAYRGIGRNPSPAALAPKRQQ
jgi:UDPglucose 6-dehydrogenase